MPTSQSSFIMFRSVSSVFQKTRLINIANITFYIEYSTLFFFPSTFINIIDILMLSSFFPQITQNVYYVTVGLLLTCELDANICDCSLICVSLLICVAERTGHVNSCQSECICVYSCQYVNVFPNNGTFSCDGIYNKQSPSPSLLSQDYKHESFVQMFNIVKFGLKLSQICFNWDKAGSFFLTDRISESKYTQI